MLSDVVLAISCDYEEQTDWGDKIGWMYGSITEDILTGLRIHTRGWISIYCNPERAAFKVRRSPQTCIAAHSVLRLGAFLRKQKL